MGVVTPTMTPAANRFGKRMSQLKYSRLVSLRRDVSRHHSGLNSEGVGVHDWEPRRRAREARRDRRQACKIPDG